jgi:hypothetical protein
VNYFYIAYGVGIHSASKIDGLECTEPQATRFSIQFETATEPGWVRSARSSPSRILAQRPESQAGEEPTFVLTEYGNGSGYELAQTDGARFVLDATAVEFKNQAVLFSGHAGYGKSTTAAALALRRVPVLTDDIVPLELTEGYYWAIPGYPRVCLWPDAVASLLGDEGGLPRLTPGWEKRYLPLNGMKARFASQKRRLGLIYLFGERSSSEDAPRIEEMGRKEALLALVQNTYMGRLIDRGQRAEEFDELSRLVQQIPVRRVVAHTDGEKLAALCDRIFEDSEKILGHI